MLYTKDIYKILFNGTRFAGIRFLILEVEGNSLRHELCDCEKLYGMEMLAKNMMPVYRNWRGVTRDIINT